MDTKQSSKPLDKPSRFATTVSSTSSAATDSISLTTALTELILAPVRLLTSPGALRAYASTALLILASFTLYFIAAVAYIVFYNAYVPDTSFTIPVHMQFDQVAHPYAVADFSDAIRGVDIDKSGVGILPWLLLGRHGIFGGDSRQRATGRMVSGLGYDIDVVMNMPRTPGNLQAGNFMLSLALLGPPSSTTKPSSRHIAWTRIEAATTESGLDPNAVILAESSRPTTLTYASPFLAYAKQLLAMPLYILNIHTESEKIRKSMMEQVVFLASSSSGSTGLAGVPQKLYLEIKGTQRLQLYSVSVEVRARFSGMRWLMSRHRVSSFVIFSTMFWGVEMFIALLVWGGASLVLSNRIVSDDAKSYRLSGGGSSYGRTETDGSGGAVPERLVKEEEEQHLEEEELDLSDTSRTFPTYSRQPPLRYSSPSSRVQVKQEEEEGESKQSIGLEADDEGEGHEDEDADFIIDEPGASLSSGLGRSGDWQGDSGIGTSLESSGGGGSRESTAAIRRRKSDK